MVVNCNELLVQFHYLSYVIWEKPNLKWHSFIMTFIATEEITEDTYTFEDLSMSKLQWDFVFFIDLFYFCFLFIAQVYCFSIIKRKAKRQ